MTFNVRPKTVNTSPFHFRARSVLSSLFCGEYLNVLRETIILSTIGPKFISQINRIVALYIPLILDYLFKHLLKSVQKPLSVSFSISLSLFPSISSLSFSKYQLYNCFLIWVTFSFAYDTVYTKTLQM